MCAKYRTLPKKGVHYKYACIAGKLRELQKKLFATSIAIIFRSQFFRITCTEISFVTTENRFMWKKYF